MRSALPLRIILASLALVVASSTVAVAQSTEQEVSGDIEVDIDRHLAAPGAITDLGTLSCPATTAEIWWWEYWSETENNFYRLDASDWPLAFAAFATGQPTPITMNLAASAALGSFALSILCVDADENTLGRADIPMTVIGQFDDVAVTSFYAAPVLFARANGITTGTSPTHFSPDDPVLRWQMALFLRRLADLTVFAEPAWTTYDDFDDTVGLAADRRLAIGWLAHAEITRGASPTEYDPDSAVTRWQMALFLRRFAAHAGIDTTAELDDFSDTAHLSDDQRQAIGWLEATGITTGIGDNRFDPSGVVTRGQMVTFLMRLVEYITAALV